MDVSYCTLHNTFSDAAVSHPSHPYAPSTSSDLQLYNRVLSIVLANLGKLELLCFICTQISSLSGSYMNIFHAQTSTNYSAHTHNFSLHCHFRVSFVINLQKSPLIASQMTLHFGGMIGTGKGLVFLPGPDTDVCACIPRVTGPQPGVSFLLSTGDRVSGVLPCPGCPLHVSSPSFVDS